MRTSQLQSRVFRKEPLLDIKRKHVIGIISRPIMFQHMCTLMYQKYPVVKSLKVIDI